MSLSWLRGKETEEGREGSPRAQLFGQIDLMENRFGKKFLAFFEQK